MFILSYTTIYFFIKKSIFSNVYISVSTLFECLHMLFWLRKRPSIKYVRKWQLVVKVVIWVHPKYVQLRTGRGSVMSHMYVPTYTMSFHVFGSIFVFYCLVLLVEI